MLQPITPILKISAQQIITTMVKNKSMIYQRIHICEVELFFFYQLENRQFTYIYSYAYDVARFFFALIKINLQKHWESTTG